MGTAANLAFGYVFSEVPWYFVACLPFWEQRRVSKRTIGLMAALMIAVRVSSALVLVLAVPNWRTYTAVAYLIE